TLGNASSNTRYIAACASLVLMVAAPVATFVILTPNAPLVMADAAMPAAMPVSPAAAPVQQTRTIALPPAEPIPLPEPSFLETLTAQLEAALPYCVIGWIVGVAALSVWYLGGWCQLQKLRRIGTKAVSAAIEANASLLSQRLGLRRAVHIVESALVQVPTVIGWLKPVILLPATALTGLDEIQLTAMIAHELAHIKRCDYLTNIAQTVVEIFGFYHPAVWWMSRQIRLERENCCDDMAVALLQDRKEYARALFSMEEIRTQQRTLAVAANGGHLTSRISRLIVKNTQHQKSGWIPSVVTILLVAALLIPTALALSGGNKDQVGKKEGINAAVEILEKVIAKYASLESYSSEGEIISDIDMSGFDGDVPGLSDKASKEARESKEFQDALKVRHNFTHHFNIKLTRDDYFVGWDQKVHAKFSNTGAAWSEGDKHFISSAGRKIPLKTRRMALASAAGVSGGAARTVPSLFFGDPANSLGELKEAKIEGEGVLDGIGCYILTGKQAGYTIKYWVDRNTHLIQRKQHIFEGNQDIPELSEEDLRSFEASRNTETDEEWERKRESMKNALVVSSKMKGSTTETHRNIVVNKPIDIEPYISKYKEIKKGQKPEEKATNSELRTENSPSVSSDQSSGGKTADALKQLLDNRIKMTNRLKSGKKMKSLGTAMHVYLLDHGEIYPARLDEAFAKSVDMHYDDWLANDVQLLVAGEKEKKERANKIPIAYDKALLNDSGTNVLFADGHVSFLQEEKLEELGIALRPGGEIEGETEVQNAEASSQKAEEKRFSFGKQKKVILPSAENNFLDFESGEILTGPQGNDSKTKVPNPNQWLLDTGADIALENSENPHLWGFGCVFSELLQEHWEAFTPKELLDVINTYSLSGKFVAPKQLFPRTFAFKTREGGIGIMQMIGFNDDSKEFEIHYKMLKNVSLRPGGKTEVEIETEQSIGNSQKPEEKATNSELKTKNSTPVPSPQSSGETKQKVHGYVTDELGRPRGNVYIVTSLSNLRNAVRTDKNGHFSFELNDETKRTWIAYSQPTRAAGLFTIPKKHDEKPLHVPLNLTCAKAEGRIVGPDGMGLAGKQIELIITTDKGISYRSQCYRKTDKYGNYTCSIPSGTGLTVQARLADADESE
ncbi:MAG: hypothetical protein DRP52_06335, partial [Planctomycetota bacterium]